MSTFKILVGLLGSILLSETRAQMAPNNTNSDIFLWENDKDLTIDPVVNLGMDLKVAKTTVLYDASEPFKPTSLFSLSSNDITFYPSKTDSVTTLLSSIVANSSSEAGRNTSIVYMIGNKYYIDNRTIDSKNTDYSLKNDTLGRKNEITFSPLNTTTCFDSRFLSSTDSRSNNTKFLVIICKEFNPKVSINNSRLALVVINATNDPVIMYTQLYNSYSADIPSITWPFFATTTNQEEVYLMVIDDNFDPNNPTESQINSTVAFFAGIINPTSNEKVNVGIGTTPVTFIWENGELALNATTPSMSSFTQANTLTVNGGTVNARNILLAFFLRDTSPFEMVCYNKDETEYTEDKLRTMFIVNNQQQFRMSCRPANNEKFASILMDKVYTPSAHKEVDIYFRVKLASKNTSSLTEFTYEFMVSKVLSISSSSSLSFMGSQKIAAPKGWFNGAKIIIVIPNKLFYVCWYYNDTSVKPAARYPTAFRGCTVVDIFTIDDSQMKATSSSEIVNFINRTIVMHSRQYGPFISLNFDLNADQTLSRMLAYYQYSYASQVNASGKNLQIYDLNKPKYSVMVKMNSNINKTFSIDGINNTIVPLSNPKTMRVSLETGTLPNKIFFSDGHQTLHTTMNNKILAPEPIVTCNTNLSNSYKSCLVTELWRYNLSYEPEITDNTTVSRIVLFDRRYIEFLEARNSATPLGRMRMGFYDLLYDNKNGTASYNITNLINMSGNKEFIGTEIYRYRNFIRGEKYSEGIYLYFSLNDSMTNGIQYGVVRYDYDTGTYKSSEFKRPVRVFESTSRYYIVEYAYVNNVTTIYICYNLKNNGEGSNKDLAANCSITNITLDEGYILDNIDSIYVEYKSAGAQLKIYIIARLNDSLSVTPVLNRLVFIQNSFDIGQASSATTIVVKPVQEIKRVLDEEFIDKVGAWPKCIYRDVIVFSQVINNTASIISFNSTKTSYYVYNYPERLKTNDTKESVQFLCANDFVDVYFKDTGDSIMLKMNSELNAFKRIRSITRNTPMKKAYTFSDTQLTHIIDDNKFIQDMKLLSKVYFKISINQSVLTDLTNFTQNYSLSSESLAKINMTIKAYDDKGANLNVTQIDRELQPVLLNHTRPSVRIEYMGNDFFSLQQKMLFNQFINQTHPVERFYSLPFDMFSVRLSNDYGNSIRVNRRLRQIRRFSINSDYNTTSSKTCSFTSYTASTVNIIDDVMLRVQKRDMGFCMELSLVQVKENSNAVNFQRMAPDILIQDFGVISDCELLKDQSVYDLDELKAKKDRGDIIEYGIACIYNENGKDFMWFLRVPIGNTVSQVFQISDNLIKVPINFTYTSFKATMVGTSFTFALIEDESERAVYLASSIITKTTASSVSLTKINGGRKVEFSYYHPNPTEIKETGLSIEVFATKKKNKDSLALDYFMKTYTVNPQNQIVDSGKDTRFIDKVTTISCAFQTNKNGLRNLNCAYLYHGSGNTIFYRCNMRENINGTESYVAPFNDIEIKSVRTIYAKGEFFYIGLAYSSVTGNRFLMALRHSIKRPIASAEFPRKNFSSYPIILYDTLNLTNIAVDISQTDFSVFCIDNNIYVSMPAGRSLYVYELSEMSITIHDNATFDKVEQTKLEILDSLGSNVGNITFGDLFRKVNPLSYMWLIIVGISLGIAGILIITYLVCKKKSTAIESELKSGINFNKDCSDAGDESQNRGTRETELL